MSISRFDSVSMTEEQLKAVSVLRDFYKEVEIKIQLGPKNREQSLALTALEDSAMWAVKAISRGQQQ